LIRVFLADIFDLTASTAMVRRIEYAFGANGEDFWERFFLCDKTHPNDRIIYLFIEHQMWILYNWWADKYKKSSIDTRKNLDFSRQKSIRSIPGMGEKYVDRIRACYVKKSEFNNQLVLQRIFFGVPPGIMRKNYIDFFDGRFKEDPLVVLNDYERRTKLTELLALRPAIEKEFGGPLNDDQKWLRYLGPETFDISSIEYCNRVNTCPFSKR